MYFLLRFFLGILFLTSSYFYAGNFHIRAQSKVRSVIEEKKGFYFGLAYGKMELKDEYTKEYFRSYLPMFLVGYAFSDHFSLEGRYYRSFKVRYDGGETFNPDQDDFPTTFSNLGVYSKWSYPFEDFSLYALLGYGKVKLSNIKGADRVEKGFQWGVGALYHINSNFDLFIDYMHIYSNKGFDGRAMKRNVKVEAFVIGVEYAF